MIDLECVKSELRVKTNTFDDEIKGLIASCLQDLYLRGVEKIPEEDPLVFRGVVHYCKAHFGYDDQPQRWQGAYESLANSMAQAKEYRKEETGER